MGLTYLHICWSPDLNSSERNGTLIDVPWDILSYRLKYMTTNSDGDYQFSGVVLRRNCAGVCPVAFLNAE